MQTAVHFLQSIVESAARDIRTERQPVAQNFPQVHDAGLAIHTNNIEIDAIAAFEVAGGKQMVHQRV